ncbi:AmmeMemoRadiSam system protein A [Desulforhopalus singaporensis]|uniref:AMMECR1 domain-containing protein n=1 Tax=Desulforhopalus singaporensis TaxID=91360 RepID=A0A1H0VA56_9BACT|nr:AmmeMemoRadiSam system protein A [Desulforhopalus singaporensis]SDP75115.1 hypothetical protein SAMN05660330_03942 [Desulforhopalus singaporensis]
MKKDLTAAQGEILLELARNTLEKRFDQAKHVADPVSDPQLLAWGAVFVTLKKCGKLRGCVGTLQPVSSIWDGVRDNTISAAFHDARFSPLTEAELADITLSISVLSEPRPLEYDNPEDLPRLLKAGVDGVILRAEGRSATFLPQVWEQLPRPELFLDHLCLKAGLPQDLWRRRVVKIDTYRVQSFQEKKQ